MMNLYDKNGLIFWNEEQIKVRRMIEERFVLVMGQALKKQNRAFEMVQVEAPLLTPRHLINDNYTGDNIFMPATLTQDAADETRDIMLFDNIALRPETTMGSYQYARYLLDHHTGVRLPLCVWQHGKSFRREQDQPQKHMRLKEFYQLEFQCLYGLTTGNDYRPLVLDYLLKAFVQLLGPCKVEESDRLPDYSESTMDIVLERTGLELCSISRRKDFTRTIEDDQGRRAAIQGAHCLEVAIGTDRVMANFLGILEN
jgi:glycyl-tRNA synthetase